MTLYGHELIDHVFRDLMPAHGMTVREEQIALSHRMLDAMENRNIALCDAGTGIGKTYAYLAAGIAFMSERDRDGRLFQPVLISTSSIALQNAVLNEYLPFLTKILMADEQIRKPIEAVIRKGKQHYACDYRLQQRLRKANMEKKNKAAANALTSLRTQLDIDRAERLSDYDRERVCVPEVCDCHRNTCRYLAFLNECEVKGYPFQICNHNLLLADAIHRSTGRRSLLPAGCAVVIDEAHKLPEAARQMFGMTLEAKDIRNLIAALKAEKYTASATNLQKAAAPLLDDLENHDGDREFAAFAKHLALLDRALSIIRSTVQDRATPMVIRRLKELARTVTYLLEESNQTVRYVSVNETGEGVLCATVTNLGVRLTETMWERPCPYILTSGTMAVGISFQRFREETGLGRGLCVRESVSLSPFDYENNCRLYLPKKPVPASDPQYYDKISSDIAALVRASCGHGLVLFTSYAAMSAVKERLLEKHLPWPVFTLNHNANYVVEQFRRSPGAVLLATGAAWEGFDFPGDSVSMLIIPRLPFPLPDAVKEAERERYDTLRDYIRAVIVPEMQIKLKQGFGRAIRTETDTCAVAILDERACVGGRYHEDVLSALPEMRRSDTMQDIEDYIRSVKSEHYFTEGDENCGEERERGLLRSPQSA